MTTSVLAGNRRQHTPNYRRWATTIVLLYAGLLVAITAPAFFVLLVWPERTWKNEDIWLGVGAWQYCVIVAALTAAQFGLLTTRIDSISRRPSGKRGLLLPVSAGLLGGALVAGAFVSVMEFVRRDHTPDWTGWTAVAIALASWGVWTFVFARATHSPDGSDPVARVCGRLLRGSVLELLIAVPTHVVARRRGYCCAGIYTGVGIGLGIAVMLASFGPAVLVLFADRWRQLHPSGTAAGTVKA